jgi:hypothetical protein
MRFAGRRDGTEAMKGLARRAPGRGAWLAAGLLALSCAVPAPAPARDTLGVFESWGAFRDPRAGRCYAISRASNLGAGLRWQPFAAIGYWPRKRARGQVNIRLSRELAKDVRAELVLGDKRFALVGGGADVWAKDKQEDAAIVAAIRAGGTMSVHGRSRTGERFSDRYALRGAATAIDAAALGCARIK